MTTPAIGTRVRVTLPYWMPVADGQREHIGRVVSATEWGKFRIHTHDHDFHTTIVEVVEIGSRARVTQPLDILADIPPQRSAGSHVNRRQS